MLTSKRLALGIFFCLLAQPPGFAQGPEPGTLPGVPAVSGHELPQAEEALTRRLSDLEAAQQAEAKLREQLAAARAVLDEMMAGEEAGERERATAEGDVAAAEEALAEARQETATRQEAYDRALARYRLARRNLDLQRMETAERGDDKEGEPIAAVLGGRSRAERLRLEAELAAQKTLVLQDELEAVERQRDQVRRSVAEVREQLLSPLAPGERQKVEEREIRLEREDDELASRVQQLRQSILEAKVAERIKQEDVRLETEDYSRRRRRLLYTAALVAACLLLILLARRIAKRRIADFHRRYSFNKLLSVLASLVVVGGFLFTFAEDLSQVATGLGVAVAGVAIALQETVASFFAGFLVRGARGYQTGHFVRIGQEYGEVIDIGWLLTVLRELTPPRPDGTGGGSPTGAIIFLGHNAIFKGPVVNYSRGVPFQYAALRYVVTFESDWRRAEELIREALAAEKEIESTAAQSRRRLKEMAGEFAVRQSGTEPVVRIRSAADGVQLTTRFLVHPSRKPGLLDQVERRILAAFDAEPAVQLAYKTIRTIPTP